MKKLIALAIILVFALIMCACENDVGNAPSTDTVSSGETGQSTVDTPSSTDTGSSKDTEQSTVDTPSSVDTEPSIDEEQSKFDTDESKDTESSVDSKPSTDTESSINTENSTVDSQPQIPDNPPPPPPSDDEKEDVDLVIAENGESDYVVVYDDSDLLICSFTNNLLTVLKNEYSITLRVVPMSQSGEYEKRIIIGDNGDINRVKERLHKGNDFTMGVRGNDYVMYAKNPTLYAYMLEILKSDVLPKINEGTWTQAVTDNFLYSESVHKDITYTDYVLKGEAINQAKLLTLFQPFVFTAKDGTSLPVRIYVPYDYDDTKSYPVLTFLHGAGERGTDNTSQLKNMVLNLFMSSQNPVWNSIVICPQCPGDNRWVDHDWEKGNYMVDRVKESNELKAVIQVLDTVKETYQTDTKRYYVTGLSMGGFGTWDLIMRHPDIFAAAVPLCGGADIFKAQSIKDMPIYTVHGSSDGSVPCSGTREMVKTLKQFGSPVIYEELVGYGHNVWDYASNNFGIWKWLFEQNA